MYHKFDYLIISPYHLNILYYYYYLLLLLFFFYLSFLKFLDIFSTISFFFWIIICYKVSKIFVLI
jgi:hypothetical protein